MNFRTPEQQQQRLLECLADTTCKVTYWCSDQWGGPANHPCDDYGADWRAYPGRVDDIGGKPEACSSCGLHGTDHPHQWKGCRVWIVALWNWMHDGNKYAATKREIICEIAPESVIDPAIALRIQLPNLLIVGSSFYGSSFYGSSFDRSSFDGSSFDGSRFYGSSFDGSSFYGSSFDGSSFYRSSFDRSSFDGSSFYRSRFDRSSCDGSSFYRSSFDRSSFYGSSFYGSSFYGSRFDGSSFYGSSFDGSRFDGSSFDRSRFDRSSFYGSSFYGSYISDTCTFVGSQFKNCTGITKDQRAMMAARGALFVDVESE